MDGMTKMWISLIGIGMMAVAAFLITIARLKTKGIIKLILSTVAFVLLFIGFICGLISIM